jgi:ADP-ribose pyrophosphatase YjhB (NUDIX family)
MTSLDQAIAALQAQAEEIVEWPPIQLRARTYLTTTLPPLELVSSVRAVVQSRDQLLVVRDPVGVHILPGGRRESGETLVQTLQREVLEETGWTIRDLRLLGFVHFHHLTPEPVDYRYPYPDFLHVIYQATADHYDAQQREPDGYELDATLQPLAIAAALPLSQGERVLLKAAIGSGGEADSSLAI